MSMEETIKRFGEQFDWMPEVQNPEKLGTYNNFLVCGMGGSHLGAWLITTYGNVSIAIHRDYGLPFVGPDTLVILSSYSGDTEETMDAARVALERGLPVAAISTGGKLLEWARKYKLPYIQIPDHGLEPRMAIGYSMLGIAKVMEHPALEKDIRIAGKSINPMAGKAEGKRIGAVLADKIPVIYASSANTPLAYIWKIKFNETAKIPAFHNGFPDLCHNEMTGFDTYTLTRAISKQLHVVILDDPSDYLRMQKRMHVASDMLTEHGIPVEHVALEGGGFVKAFNAALLADWITLDLAERYKVPNPETPMVAEFKRRMSV